MRARICVCVLLTLACVLAASVAGAADWDWDASLTAGGEYNDNVEEKSGGDSDFVVILKPSASVSGGSSRAQMSVKYFLEYRDYIEDNDTDETNHNLDASALFTAVENLFYIDIRDRFRQVYRDSTRGDNVEGDTTTEQTDQNDFNISPYFEFMAGKKTWIRTGYRYQNLWYSDDDSIDKSVHHGFFNTEHDLTARFKLLGDLLYRYEDPDEGDGLQRYTALAGGQWEYSSNGTVYAKAGPSYTDYEGDDDDDLRLSWDAGLTHEFGRYTLLLKTNQEYVEDPEEAESRERRGFSGEVAADWGRTQARAGVSYYTYSRTTNSPKSETWRPSASVIHSLTSRLDLLAGVTLDYENNRGENDVDRQYANAGLRYQFLENFFGEASYLWKNVNEDGGDDYSVNRFVLTLTYNL